MSEDRPPTLDIHTETARMRAELDDDGRKVLEYWHGLRPSPDMPPRKARIDPIDFSYALPSIAIVDVRGTRDDFHYRLVGTRDVEERGHDPTWKKVKDTFFAHAGDVVLDLYEDTRNGVPFVAVERFRKENGVPIIDVALFLPLTDEGGLVIAAMVYSHRRPDGES